MAGSDSPISKGVCVSVRSLDANGIEVFDMTTVVDVVGEKVTLGTGQVLYGVFSEETNEMVLHESPDELHRWRGAVAVRKPEDVDDIEMRGDSIRFPRRQAPSGAFSQPWRS